MSRSQGLPASSVNFGPFGGVGMAAGYAESMRAVGLHPLPPSAAHSAFLDAGYASKSIHARLAASQFLKVNTVSGPWTFLDRLCHLPCSSNPSLNAFATDTADLHNIALGQKAAAEETFAAPAIHLEDLIQMVRSAASELLGEDIGADGHFAAGHFDSLAAVELSNALGKTVGRDLPGTLVFDYPSVGDTARYLHSLLAPKQVLQGAPAAIRADETITALAIRPREPGSAAGSLLRVTVAARLPELATGTHTFDQDVITTAPNSRCGAVRKLQVSTVN